MSATLSADCRFSPAPDHLSSRLGDGAVILDLASGTYFGLDAVGARVWDLLQTDNSITSIVNTIVSEFDVAPEVCLRDVQDLLTQMHAQGLVHTIN